MDAKPFLLNDKENEMGKYNNDFSHCFLGKFKDGGNIDQIDYTILKVSYDTHNSIYSVHKNEVEDFKEWIVKVILPEHIYDFDETQEYDKFLDGNLDADEIFDEVGLSIHEII